MSDIQERLTAALAETYVIEQPLGEGGMALVYLARDVKHDRQVAIKVLRPDLAASLGAERFLREIRITAKLQHPHILPLYDSGEADGLLYYVMPFVEGESLADFIAREKQLSIDETIRIAKEVAGALGHAHAYGLIHRDIKPDNIMMSGGHAIVADFGIAKAVSDAGGSGVTSTGTSIGTPAYMSPEQAAGDPNLDGRTDIYALGCMLYEMLIGQPPFTGPNAQAIMARHTMDQVPPPSIMRQSIPPELEDVIFCAMAKTPADRFRTAQEMVEALTAVETGGSPKLRTTRATTRVSLAAVTPPLWKRAVVPVVSAVGALAIGGVAWQLFFAEHRVTVDTGLNPSAVAVLYFEDVTPGEDLGYIADGITEGLIDRLQTVPALRVISRSGVEPFRDPTIRKDSVGRALDVGSIVSGSVQRVGDRLEVSASLYDGFDGSRVAGSTLTLPASDLIAAQDSVVEAVSLFLRERIGEEFRAREQRSATTSDDAWRLLQRAERRRKDAEELVKQGEGEAAVSPLEEADSLLAQAVVTDPGWIEPRLSRGWVAYQRGQAEEGRQQIEWLQSAVEHANEALGISSNDARALALRGTARFGLYQAQADLDQAARTRLLEDARSDLEDAVAADPTLASAFITLSYLYYAPEVDDVPLALDAARRGYEADAYLENADETIYRLFWGTMDTEALRQARQWCAEGHRRFPDDWWTVDCQLWLSVTPEVEPDVARAWQLRARLDTLTQSRFRRVRAEYLVGGVLARAGLTDSARRVFDRARSEISSEFDPELELYAVEAYVRTLSGDLDESIDLLKRFRVANPEHDFSKQLGTWWWRSLRNHPRYRELGIG